MALKEEILCHSYLKKYYLYYPDFFLLKIIKYFLCSHNKQKRTNKKGGSPFSFHCKMTTKGQLQLQIIILRNGTGASF